MRPPAGVVSRWMSDAPRSTADWIVSFTRRIVFESMAWLWFWARSKPPSSTASGSHSAASSDAAGLALFSDGGALGRHQLVERRQDVLADGDDERELIGAQLAGDVVDQRQVVRVDDDDFHLVALPAYRQDGVVPEELGRELPEQVGSDGTVSGRRRERDLEMLRQAAAERDLVDPALGDQDVLDGAVVLRRHLARLPQPVARDEAALEQIIVGGGPNRVREDLLEPLAGEQHQLVEDLEPLLVDHGVLRAMRELHDAGELAGDSAPGRRRRRASR